ncbi:head completion/stabilization protein [Pseudomonas sp. B392_1p]|uniref:head completion/stabilization protein n=1 Tax=Pseudomonas sp. B392_1p TaxID=3457507 RepID=UPI003FD07E6F
MSFGGKPTTFVEQAIENNGFWPDLSVSEFQKGYRLPAEYLVELLVADLTTAMVEVNVDLERRQADLSDAGVELTTHQVATYKRAVYCRAKASLLPQFATVTRRESAENTGKELPDRAETFLAFSQQAVRTLQKRGRITAVLL